MRRGDATGAPRLLGALLAAVVLALPAVPVAGAGAISIKPEHARPGPGFEPGRPIPPQMPTQQRKPFVSLQATASSAGFLTMPFVGDRRVTSIFDHCGPDYTPHGKVCRFDGAVALRANGVDPAFSLGYAQTPRGTDYLYYDGHNGYDYGLLFEVILAAADGTVRFTGPDPINPCFGQTVVIDHPNGLSTRYSHLSSILVPAGLLVRRGQAIAVSGNSGCSTGPHLHFGLYLTSSWTAIDPFGWIGAGPDPWPWDAGNLWLTGLPQFPLPSAPGGVFALTGNGAATVSWTAPSFDAGIPISGYTVTASPGGQSVSVPPTATTAVVNGLNNGTGYTFTVTATNFVGSGAPSFASNRVTPPQWPGPLRPLSPARILDTRDGTGGFGGPIGAGQTIDVPVVGRASIPNTGVAAVVLNLTATGATESGYLTLYPTGQDRPLASNLNFGPQETVPNLVTVAIGVGGKVSLYNPAGSTHAILDVLGWISAGGDAVGTAGQYRALAPSRLLDTRDGTGGFTGPLGTGQNLDLAILGRSGIPFAGVSAVALNVIVTNPTAASYLTVSPSGSPRPLASNLNFSPNQTVANRVIVPVGSEGKVSLFNFAGQVDVVVDINGWFSDGSIAFGSGGLYTGLSPARILDTRTGTGGVTGPVGSRQSILLTVAGLGGVPAAGGSAVVLNVTVVNPTAPGYLAMYPSGTLPSVSSELNFPAGKTVANLVLAKPGADGRLLIFNSAGATDVVVDVLAWIG